MDLETDPSLKEENVSNSDEGKHVVRRKVESEADILEESPEEDERCCTPQACKIDEVWYQTSLLMLINMLLFADQNLMAPNLTAIALDLGLSVPEERDLYLGGYVALGFFCIGAFSSFIAGFLADNVNRLFSYAGVVLIGQGACMGTFFVQNYPQFLALRILTGVAIGGSIPLQYSLLGDLFRTTRRGRILSLAAVTMSVGVGAGQILAGLIGPALSWRVPFLVVSIPAFVLTILLVTTTSEPRRGLREEVLQAFEAFEDFSYDESLTCEKVKELLSTPSVALLLACNLPASLPWGVILVYFNDYVVQELGIPESQSTLMVLCYGLGVAGGALTGGYLGDHWVRGGATKLVCLTGSCFILSCAPLIGLLYMVKLQLWVYLILCLPSGFVAGIPTGSLRAMLVNVSMPEVRGTTFACMNLVDDLGRGLGPFLVSLIIIAFQGNRAYALSVSFAAWVLSGILVFPLVSTFSADFEKVEETIVRNHLLRNPHHHEILFRSGHRNSTEDFHDYDPIQPLELELR